MRTHWVMPLTILLFTLLPIENAHSGPILVLGEDGRLAGASGVTVGAFGTFNVRFVDGTCIEVFSGCNEQTDFDFYTPEETVAASTALLDQVLVGNFDDDPALIWGCSDAEICGIFTPANAFIPSWDSGYVVGTAALNTAFGYPVEDTLAPNELFGPLIARDLTTADQSSYRVWARWTEVHQVPEPSSLMLFGLGIASLFASRRRYSSR